MKSAHRGSCYLSPIRLQLLSLVETLCSCVILTLSMVPSTQEAWKCPHRIYFLELLNHCRW